MNQSRPSRKQEENVNEKKKPITMWKKKEEKQVRCSLALCTSDDDD